MPVPEIVRCVDIRKFFPITKGILKREVGRINVLNGIDLSIMQGERLGLVGESGCGKSTLAKLILNLMPPSGGSVLFSDTSVSANSRRLKKQFYQHVQMIFQDPYSSLNPRLRVKNIIGEMIRIRGVRKNEERRRVIKLLEDVGLDRDSMEKFPHEFSGGQRQRIAIARALIVRPKLLVADEPISALDLATQAQILSLLKGLKKKYNLTIMIISHDLNASADFCDRVAVMYLGRIVEIIRAHSIFINGRHPYLKALINAMPVNDPVHRLDRKKIITGEIPSPDRLPSGCMFHPRCPYKLDICLQQIPPLIETDETAHFVACHLWENINI